MSQPQPHNEQYHTTTPSAHGRATASRASVRVPAARWLLIRPAEYVATTAGHTRRNTIDLATCGCGRILVRVVQQTLLQCKTRLAQSLTLFRPKPRLNTAAQHNTITMTTQQAHWTVSNLRVSPWPSGRCSCSDPRFRVDFTRAGR
jgi:hypothetical protein